MMVWVQETVEITKYADTTTYYNDTAPNTTIYILPYLLNYLHMFSNTEYSENSR